MCKRGEALLNEFFDDAERICDEDEELMDNLPRKICEWLDEPLSQLEKIEEIFLTFGQRILLKTYFMTYVVELYGGLMTNEDQQTGIFRRRSPGGTFYTMFKCVNMKEVHWINRAEYLKKHRFAYKHERARKYRLFERVY